MNRVQDLLDPLRRFLRECPVPVKVFFASSAFLLLGLLTGWLLGAARRNGAQDHSLLAFLATAGSLSTALVLLNQALLRRALQPFRVLEEVSRRLSSDDFSTPVPRPAFTDPAVERLLDQIERLLSQIQAQREMLARMSSRSIRRLEAERMTVAQELHDDVAQRLATLLALLRVTTDALAEQGGPCCEEELERLSDIRDLARSALEQVRRLSHGLHPLALDHGGLASGLRWLVKEHLADRLPDTMLEVSLSACTISPMSELCLFRIAQEALSNVIRHSSARNAWVRLTCDGEEVVLQIADDGVGFDDGYPDRDPRNHLGLYTMRERAQLAGGLLEITSAPSVGTKVTARVPCRVQGDDSDTP